VLRQKDSTIEIYRWKQEAAGSDLVRERQGHAAELQAARARATETLAAVTAEMEVGRGGR
jgi:hypothetical protein